MTDRANIFWTITAYVVALSLFLLATRHGMIWTNDSRSYVDAALNEFGPEYKYWPPLYPLLLGWLLRLGESVDVTVRMLNLACLLLTMMFARKIVRTLGAPLSAQQVVLIIIAATQGIFQVWHAVWSEPVFIVFTLWAFLLMVQTSTRNTYLAMVLGTVAGAAFYTRYLGLILVYVGARVVMQRAVRPWLTLLIYLLFAVLPTAIWVVGSAFLGAPRLEEQPAPLWQGYASVVLVIGIGVYYYRTRIEQARPLAWFAMLYGVALAFGIMLGNIDPVGPRLLYPAMIALLLAFAAPSIKARALQPVAANTP